MRSILAGVSRHPGEKRAFIGIATALVTAVVVAPALAGENGAQRVDFFSIVPVQGCDLVQPGTGSPTSSFAVINRNPAGTEVAVQIHLKDAQPNTTYSVAIWENGCAEGDFYQVRTNNQGNETRHLKGIVSPGTTISDVILTARASGGADFKQTPKVTFGP